MSDPLGDVKRAAYDAKVEAMKTTPPPDPVPSLSAGEMAEELRSRLPEPRYGHGRGRNVDEVMHGDLCIAVEGDQWEIEWVPLDPKRNICLRRPSLADALAAVLAHDDQALDRGVS